MSEEDSKKASEEEFRKRIKREEGKIGTLTISLSWNTVRCSAACQCECHFASH